MARNWIRKYEYEVCRLQNALTESSERGGEGFEGGSYVKATGRLARTRANEGGDDTNLPYEISARDFRHARLSHLRFFFRSGPVACLGPQLYNLPPPFRPSPSLSLSSCIPLAFQLAFVLSFRAPSSRCMPLERLAFSTFSFRPIEIHAFRFKSVIRPPWSTLAPLSFSP